MSVTLGGGTFSRPVTPATTMPRKTAVVIQDLMLARERRLTQKMNGGDYRIANDNLFQSDASDGRCSCRAQIIRW